MIIKMVQYNSKINKLIFIFCEIYKIIMGFGKSSIISILIILYIYNNNLKS
jgi:hypothetical protein